MDDNIILKMANDISGIQTSLIDFRREMLGNGQPGRIQVLESNINVTKAELQTVKESHAFERGRQTRWSGYVSLGVTAVLTFCWEALKHHFGWLSGK